MKKLILVLCVIVLMFGIISVGYCEEEPDVYTVVKGPAYHFDRDEIPYKTNPINKLERGIINIATFWMEIPAEVARVSKEQDPAAGMTVGLVNGTATSVARAATGVYDAYTFMTPSYTKPAMDPAYAWTALDDKLKALFW